MSYGYGKAIVLMNTQSYGYLHKRLPPANIPSWWMAAHEACHPSLSSYQHLMVAEKGRVIFFCGVAMPMQATTIKLNWPQKMKLCQYATCHEAVHFMSYS